MNINFKKKFLFSFLFLLILSLGSVFATPSITINPLITNDTTPVISGNFDLDSSTLSSIAVIIGGVTYSTGSGTITATGTDWSIPNISTLTEGTYEVATTLTTGPRTFNDNTNNELTIDTTSPVVDVGADVTSNSLFTKDATVTDTTSLTYLWEDVTVEGAGTITFGSSASQNTTISANTDGIYTIRLTATDAAGNDSSFDEFTLTWDETLPSGYSVSIDQSYINDSNKDALSFTFTDAEVGTTYNYSIDDGNEDTSAITNTGIIATASDQITGIDVSTLSDDTLTLTLTLTDLAGNVGVGVTDTITKDTTSPVVDVGANVISNETITKDATVTDTTSLTYLWEDVTVEGAGTITFGSSTSQDTTISANTDGIYTIKLTATDAAGNASSDEFTLTWDETLPSGYSVSIDQSYINDSNKDALSFTFIDAEVGTTYNYSIDDTNVATSPITDTGIIETASDQITEIDVSALSDGILTLTVNLIDSVNNQGLDVTDTVTKDTILPTMISATKDSETQITITMSEIISTNETNPTDFIVTDSANQTFVVSSQLDNIEADNLLVLTTSNMSSSIGNLTVTYNKTDSSVLDVSRNEFTSDAIGIILDSVNYVSLVQGYNFFALPKNATNNTVSSVFNNIESAKVIYDFNKTTGLFTALDSSDKLIPLNGYIVNLIGNGSAKITYDTTILNYPGAKELTAGWNLIGNTNTSTTNILDILAGCISPNNGYYWDNTIQFDSTTQNYNLAVIAGNASNVSVGESFWINIKNGESCTIAALTN